MFYGFIYGLEIKNKIKTVSKDFWATLPYTVVGQSAETLSRSSLARSTPGT
jgi:hypothetical protein